MYVHVRPCACFPLHAPRDVACRVPVQVVVVGNAVGEVHAWASHPEVGAERLPPHPPPPALTHPHPHPLHPPPATATTTHAQPGAAGSAGGGVGDGGEGKGRGRVVVAGAARARGVLHALAHLGFVVAVGAQE